MSTVSIVGRAAPSSEGRQSGLSRRTAPRRHRYRAHLLGPFSRASTVPKAGTIQMPLVSGARSMVNRG